jgi:hypothetical protein
MHNSFDCDDVQLKNLVEDSTLIVSSILMPSRPCAFKSIAMPNDLDEEIKIAWEVLKPQLIAIKKHVFHYKFFSHIIFFVVNDGSNVVLEKKM